MAARAGKRDRGASGGATPGSASEHAISTWRMAFAFANVGICGAMVKSRRWGTSYRLRPFTQLIALLESKENPAGILLNEVGNLGDLVQGQGARRPTACLRRRSTLPVLQSTAIPRFSGAMAKRWVPSARK